MAEDTRQPDTDASKAADVPDQSAAGDSPAGASPSADSEKNSKVEDAKARVAAAREAAAAGAPAAPKAPVKKKEEGPKPVDASAHPLVARLKATLNGAVLEAVEFLGQLAIRIEPARIVQACDALRTDPETPFNYLSDVTCVHFPAHPEAPFDIVYNLYSIEANERVRLKVAVDADPGVDSVTGVWPAANWMEREVYDLFGVNFRNHRSPPPVIATGLGWISAAEGLPLEFVENA